MAKFTDADGNSWNLRLTVGAIEDVKEHTKIDLDDVLKQTDKFADLILSNPRKLAEIFYVLCVDQIQERGYDPKRFARIFDRATLDAAIDAFLEAIADFYPRASVGAVVRENMPRMLREMDQKLAEATRKRIDGLYSKNATN